MASPDLSPAYADLIKLGPVVSILLICIVHLVKEGRKKDAKNEKLTATLISVTEKQAETVSLVRDRLLRIEQALKLRKRLAAAAEADEGSES